MYLEGKVCKLSAKERELLKILFINEKHVLSLEEIYSALWEYEEEPSELSLRVYIKDLRQIVGKDNILTRKGEGYCYKKVL